MKEGIFTYFKEILFPCFCVDCKQEGQWWCQQCLKKLEVKLVNKCPVCEQFSQAGEVCPACRDSSWLDGVLSLFSYQEGNSLAKLIKQFKYNFTQNLEVIWKEILNKQFDSSKLNFFLQNHTLIPVPLHKKRQRQRGFNQSQILAEIICQKKNLNMSINSNDLVRTRYTNQQAKLSGQQRRQNLASAFAWQGKNKAPEQVLLIDDVFTTGTTLQECAKVLKKNGSKRVWGFVLARG